MPSNTVINEKVRNTLDSKKKVMGRTNLDSDPYKSASNNKKSYLKNISRTPYAMMVSERMDRVVETEETEGLETFTDNEATVNETPKSLALTLSNQEFSNIDKKEVTYGTKSYNARGNKNRPTAGITGLSSEYVSSGNVNFVKKATINWTCHSLEDLQVLSERFLTLSSRVYVEFGWVLPGDKEKRAKFIDDAGNLDISLSADSKTINTEIAKRVIEMGEGTFEAFIGRIENFSITSREDGGFDCTTELMANGINVLDAKTESNPETNVEIDENDILQKDLTKLSFQNAINNLPSSMLRILKDEKSRNRSIYKNLESATGQKTYDEKGYYDKSSGEKITKKEYKKSEDQDRYEWIQKETQYSGYEKETKRIFNDNNLVVIHSSGITTEEYSTYNNDAAENNPTKRKKGVENIETDPNECWVRWGWFEDNLLNRYFSLVSEVGTNNEISPEVEIRSIEVNKVVKQELQKKRDESNPFAASGIKSYSGAPIKTTEYSIGEEVDENGIRRLAPDSTYNDESKGLSGDYKISTTVKTNSAFKTTNFKEFIFPGKFKLEREQGRISELREKSYDEYKKSLDEYHAAYKERTDLGGDKAKKATQKELDIVKKQTEALNTYQSTFVDVDGVRVERENLTIEQAKKIVEDYDFNRENLNLKETGVVPLLTMTALETAFNEIAGKHSFETDNNEEGYLRNIFINVGLLQNIFGDGGATTLGENFNRLSEKLQQNSLGLIKLKAENDPDQPGNIKFNSAGFTKSDDYFIKKAKENNELYVFPVWQNDSIVISQAIESDLNSELQKVEYVKEIANQDLTDNGLSIYHQWNFNSGIVGDPQTPENPDMQNKKRLRPVFLVDNKNGTYFNYGEKNGDANVKLSKNGPSLWEDDYNPIIATEEDRAKKDAEDKKKADEKSKTDADIQGEMGVASFLGFNSDGTMVTDEITKMKKNINKKPDNSGRPVTTQDEYGLIFISNTIQISGIAGIKPGDIWTTNYLPKKFQERAHFWTKNVEHSLDSTGWNTTITGQMAWSLGSE